MCWRWTVRDTCKSDSPKAFCPGYGTTLQEESMYQARKPTVDSQTSRTFTTGRRYLCVYVSCFSDSFTNHRIFKKWNTYNAGPAVLKMILCGSATLEKGIDKMANNVGPDLTCPVDSICRNI